MELTSPGFKHNASMPEKYSCDGIGVSPELNIKDIPAGAKSLALILDDPDAPSGTFVHWVAYDLSPVPKIAEGAKPGKSGKNSANRSGYYGPCPPNGTHHYIFHLYALDQVLNLPEGLSKKQLLDAMKGHILETAELVGLYSRD